MPEKKAIIKRVLMLSNGPGVQPKSLAESDHQFKELLTVLDIPLSLRPSEKLAKLRALPAKTLIETTSKLHLHQFRAVTDNAFVSSSIIASLSKGTFAQRLKQRGIKIMMGECSHEHFLYGLFKPPSPNYTSLSHRLAADYPSAAVSVLMAHYFPSRTLGTKYQSWTETFGHIYADVQIHALQRGMADALAKHGAGHLIHRYRIEWRAACVDSKIPRQFGPTHTSDLPIWFWGNGDKLTGDEKRIVAEAFQKPLKQFLDGDKVDWGAEGDAQIRTLKGDGRVIIEDDGERIHEALELWNALEKANMPRAPPESKL